jgi:hypothetical protein
MVVRLLCNGQLDPILAEQSQLAVQPEMLLKELLVHGNQPPFLAGPQSYLSSGVTVVTAVS